MPTEKQVKKRARAPRAAALHHDAPGHTKEANEDLQKEIAGRELTEQALQESEERYRRLFEVESDAILLGDRETGRFVDANPAALKLYGYSLREFLSLKPSDISAEPERTRQAIAEGQTFVALRWHRKKDGTIFPTEVTIRFFDSHKSKLHVAAIRDITERRQAEETLRRSETKFRTLYDSTSNAIMLLGENGFFDCNPATLAVFGCATREEFCSKHPADLSPPIQPDGTDSRTLANRQIATALEKGSHQFEWMHKRADNGGVFPADVLLSVMGLDGKRVLMATVRDLTERKQAEEAVSDAMEMQRAIFDSTTDFIWAVDFQRFRLLMFNRAFRDYTLQQHGHRLQVGQRPEDLLPNAEYIERWHGYFHRALASGPFTTEYLAFSGKATLRLTFNLLKHNDAVFGVSVFAKDITEQKRAEEALRESEAKLRGVFESSRDAIGLAIRGMHVFANLSYLELFGFKNNEQLAGASILNHIAPSHRQQILHNIERRAAGEEVPTLYETRGVKTNGHEFDMEVSVSTFPLHGEICTLATIRDITERKQAEMRMQMFSHEVVVARENEKRHLSSVLHHDVGSLAVGISAYLDAIEADLHSGKPGKALRWMPRTRKLFDQSLKRLKGLAVELRPPELDVLGLDAALRQHFSLVTKRGGIRIRFKEGQHGNRLGGDTAIVLFRVAQESLTNAITHGLAKHVAVDLLTLQKEVRLTIRDDGKGFDSSQQMNLPMSHLGLRVMREMADFVGGAFTIDSSPGKGTTVRLTLPIQTAPAPAPQRRGKGLKLAGAAVQEETTARGRNIRSASRSARPRKGKRA